MLTLDYSNEDIGTSSNCAKRPCSYASRTLNGADNSADKSLAERP